MNTPRLSLLLVLCFALPAWGGPPEDVRDLWVHRVGQRLILSNSETLDSSSLTRQLERATNTEGEPVQVYDVTGPASAQLKRFVGERVCVAGMFNRVEREAHVEAMLSPKALTVTGDLRREPRGWVLESEHGALTLEGRYHLERSEGRRVTVRGWLFADGRLRVDMVKGRVRAPTYVHSLRRGPSGPELVETRKQLPRGTVVWTRPAPTPGAHVGVWTRVSGSRPFGVVPAEAIEQGQIVEAEVDVASTGGFVDPGLPGAPIVPGRYRSDELPPGW